MPSPTYKKWIALNKGLLTFFIVSCFVANSFAKKPAEKVGAAKEDTIMVQKFYSTYNEPLFWLKSRKDIKRANEWLKEIESADNSGFVSDKLQTEQIRAALSQNYKRMDNFLKEKTDKQITSLVLNFIKYLQQDNIHFEYDEVNVHSDSVYIFQLIFSGYKESVSKLVEKFNCIDPDYLVLKKYMHDSIPDKNSVKYKTVDLAMNYRKYLAANHHPEYILVNIPEAEAVYYKNDVPALKMRTVPGKKTNQTPTIASYITSIVTFPAWNVPYDIAVKELLPKVQKDENYLEQHNFDVVDAKGNIVDDSELKWESYNDKNFPYFFRQSTGSDNSLGVLKFYLKNPFSIFLHATSAPEAFARDYRFLSHGCIRLEKPFELADAMLLGKIDLEELKNGKKNTESTIIKLTNKIPVFIIYLPLTVVGSKVTFLPDVYGLIK